MKKYALLIGNGLNCALNNQAWGDMLEEIRIKFGVAASSVYTNMPLEFERIYLDVLKNGCVTKAYTVKESIFGKYSESAQLKITDLSLHKEFASLPVDAIMISNYDYYIEQLINPQFKRKGTSSHTKERKHSLFRHFNINGKKFWHIHGEAYCPDSICLGYDHYCT